MIVLLFISFIFLIIYSFLISFFVPIEYKERNYANRRNTYRRVSQARYREIFGSTYNDFARARHREIWDNVMKIRLIWSFTSQSYQNFAFDKCIVN
jgi:hypothetical protein